MKDICNATMYSLVNRLTPTLMLLLIARTNLAILAISVIIAKISTRN